MDLRIDEERNMAYIKLSGLLNEKIILNAFDAAVSAKQYKNGMGRLWDFTDADLSQIGSEIIARMAQYSTKFPPGINDVKVAFITSRTLEYGLTRMFEALSIDAKTQIGVFKTIKDAEKWMMAQE